MGQSLTEIHKYLEMLIKKVQLIYAFNGSGKTRLSREFKQLIALKELEAEQEEDSGIKYFTIMLLLKTYSFRITIWRLTQTEN